MPKQKRPVAENKPISFRPGALQRDRLDKLITYRQQHRSAVLNAAIDLLFLMDLGYEQMETVMRQADVLTHYGQNESSEV